ncbi:LysR substrate-binding domain-containing protein [Acidovorax sp. CCYZU-2555]|uniref:LysR substrate-binding domain-containing protein n=1 Tax=Acidovorax sp. CCYZU-2555 TaxID=2835042 RepID=UPI001BCD6CBA|nr:LysR substrate-binding domain-containing protein [Acidovorax sp. CCYZU-2555]MBS7778938.1 LysR family transcriptional regulator [Acidovorax sp. CCYZU-2555]
MNNHLPSPEDLEVFVQVVRSANFSQAAKDLGVSASFITKRVKILETLLGAQLFHRSTRKVSLSEDGERTYVWAQRILDDVDNLLEDIREKRLAPRGVLRISSSFGFGRNAVGPILAGLAQAYPALEIRFEVFDRLVDVGAEGFDLDIRVGDEIAPHHIAKRIAANHRILCASPGYLRDKGRPRTLADLAQHSCLVIRERDHPFGVWKLRSGTREVAVRVRGPMSTNHGEIAVQWAVNDMGIVLRSIWDVQELLRAGKLVQVLPKYRQEANIWAVFPARLETSAKVKVATEWIARALQQAPFLNAAPAA